MPLVAGPFLPKGHVAVKILGWGREPCPGPIPGGLLGGEEGMSPTCPYSVIHSAKPPSLFRGPGTAPGAKDARRNQGQSLTQGAHGLWEGGAGFKEIIFIGGK